MKVLRVMGYPLSQFSSLEQFVGKQALELRATGHRMDVVFDGVAREEALDEAHRYGVDGLLKVDFPSLIGSKNILKYFIYIFRLYRTVKRGNYQLVHVYFGPAARIVNNLALFLGNVRLVRTVGTPPDPRTNNVFLVAAKRLYWRFNLRNCDAITCVCEAAKQRLVECGVDPHRLVVIHSVTDVKRFHPVARGTGSNGIVALTYAGRLEERKQIDVLIRGVAILVNEAGVDKILLRIVGEGSKKAELEQLASKEGVKNFIIFDGRREDMVDVMNNETDVYVQASRLEGFSASVREAMACEIPVVVTDTTGHQEMVEDGVNGYLFPVGDADRFAQCVLSLIKNPQLRRAMGSAGRKRIVENFSTESRIKKENELYRKLLTAGAAR